VSVDFETRPIAFADALAELVGWSGQDLHVEVSVAGGAGISGFDVRFDGVAADGDEGTVLLWFEGDIALVVLSDAMSASTDLGLSTEVSWLRFTIGEHQSVEVERLEPDEIRRTRRRLSSATEGGDSWKSGRAGGGRWPVAEIWRRPSREALTLGAVVMQLRKYLYRPLVVRTYGEDGTLLSSFEGSFDSIRIAPSRQELHLYSDLPHFLAWVGSPNGTRLDLNRLTPFRVRRVRTDDDALGLWRDGRLLMEIGPRTGGATEPRAVR
jgi:hypothetical protein